MWLSIMDEDGPIFFNLDLRPEMRFTRVRNMDAAFVQAHPNLKSLNFGQPNDLLLVLVGPGLNDFEVVLSLEDNENQQQALTLVQNSIRHGLENGTRLLDLDKLLDRARDGFHRRV